jgi:hypothetical protein
VARSLENWESWIERQIREAQERGEFDDLPGRGKPLRSIDRPHDPDWWLKGMIEREGLDMSAALPPGLRLRRELEQLQEQLTELRSEQAVREVVGDLNRRILEHRRRTTGGPPIVVQTVDVERIVAAWHAAGARPAERRHQASPAPDDAELPDRRP